MVSYCLLANSVLFPKNLKLGEVPWMESGWSTPKVSAAIILLLSFLRPGSSALFLVHTFSP